MKNKMKKISLGIFIIFISIIVFSTFAEATFNNPSVHKGDYWFYNLDMQYGAFSYQGTLRSEIIGETTITIEGESYDVWESKTYYEISYESSKSTYETLHYSRKSDGAMVKSFYNSSTTYQGETDTNVYEVIYNPIQPDMNYPIDVGDTWEIHKSNIMNDDSGTNTIQEDAYYECTGIEDVTTDAGTFSCYIINSWMNISDTGNYTISYYSNEVGVNPVKMIEYINSEPTTTILLNSYKYTSDEGDGGGDGKEDEGGNADGDGGIPGFEIVTLIGATMIVLLLLRKRKS